MWHILNGWNIHVYMYITDHIELAAFTFGDLTPSIRSVKVFECVDGVPGLKPASWSSITHPPLGLDKMSSYQVVLETDVASRCDDFRMVFRARLGGKRYSNKNLKSSDSKITVVILKFDFIRQ